MEVLNIIENAELQMTLICTYCEKYLSMPPVFQNEAQTIVCGRCKPANGHNWSRQYIYESLAKYMSFPCSNLTYGCKMEVKFEEAERHELNCIHKKINCPLFVDNVAAAATKRCLWIGSGPQLNEHIESVHAELMGKVPEFNFSDLPDNQIFLARFYKQLLIISVRKDQELNKVYFMVMLNGTTGDCDDFRYQLELYDDQKKHSFVLRKNNVADVVCMMEDMLSEDKGMTIDLNMAGEMLGRPPRILGRLGVLKKSVKNESGRPQWCSLNAYDPGYDEGFVRELECPICKNYMLTPIFMCETGHSLCEVCRNRLDTCPTCKQRFSKARNYAMEQLAALVDFPCVNRDVGCLVFMKADKIREHERDCCFNGTHCFIPDCLIPVAQSRFLVHLASAHKAFTLAPRELSVLDMGNYEIESLEKTYAICFGNEIFKLCVKYVAPTSITFLLGHCGAKESNYIYETEIICSNDSYKKMSLMNCCQGLKKSDSVLDDSQFISIPYDLLVNYISNDSLIFFKIHLKKKV